MANVPYDRFGQPYNITRVLTADQTFDPAAFDKYSPLYLPASFAITYLVAFALSSAMIVHTVLYHGKTVLRGLTQTRIEKDDIHAKLMRAYPEVPDWWYLLTFIACFALAIVTAEVRILFSALFICVRAYCARGDLGGLLTPPCARRCGTRRSRCGRWSLRSRPR